MPSSKAFSTGCTTLSNSQLAALLATKFYLLSNRTSLCILATAIDIDLMAFNVALHYLAKGYSLAMIYGFFDYIVVFYPSISKEKLIIIVVAFLEDVAPIFVIKSILPTFHPFRFGQTVRTIRTMDQFGLGIVRRAALRYYLIDIDVIVSHASIYQSRSETS